MKVIIAGSRTINNISVLIDALERCPFTKEISEVVSGKAAGADRLGEMYAKDFKKELAEFPADWATHGKKAGILRNIQMAEYADALIALWDGKSSGTSHMIDTANEKGLEVFVHNLSEAA